jgi:hypothetical protein
MITKKATCTLGLLQHLGALTRTPTQLQDRSRVFATFLTELLRTFENDSSQSSRAYNLRSIPI